MKTLSDFAVGQTFQLVREVDPHRPIYYAAASGDFNPIHVDPAAAKAAGLGGVILQGMCTHAWLSDACVAYLGDPIRLQSVRARFAKPVRPGDTLTFAGRCTAIDGDTVRVEVEVTNQHGEEVLKRASATGLVRGER
ncbi:MAG TPA: MaoC/PaaZ C-terminal domain-containing protein [Anaeromyxobacteraceae bacterium]|nr:MaoC/PaaZ C-terminal domain-containing protein [Anaeromyxobacteraceae bacterium]